MCESGIDEIGSLNCIIKLSRLDLSNNRLLVTSRELGRTATRIVFPLGIHLLTNFADSTHAHTSVIMNLMIGIALFQEKENRGAFGCRNGSHDGGKGQKLKESSSTFQINTNNVT